MLLIGFFALFLPLRHYRRERTYRDTLRRGALLPTEHKNIPVASRLFTPFDERFERLHLESQPKKENSRRLIMVIGLFVVLQALNYLLFFGPDWIKSFVWSILTMMLGLLLINAGVTPLRVTLKRRVAATYLLPSLKADEEGISARYGKDAITMRWRDIRYFALVDSASFRGLIDPKQKKPDGANKARAAYEISDGENRICWLDAPPFSSQLLLLNGESEMSEAQYTTFAQQLASQVSERTELPLYDFRVQKKTK